MAYMSASMKDGFFHAVDVVGCLNYPEVAGLTAVQQDVLRLIVSAGYVDLSGESQSKTKLFAFFPDGTVTRAALNDLRASHTQQWIGEMT